MSKNNFKVETAVNGQTPKQDTKHKFATANIAKDKTPTGNVKTLKDKEALKAAREEEYKNFRVNALKRRAKRMGLSDEQTKVKVEELLKQMAAPTNYDITIMFNPADYDMVKQALMNDDITWKFLVTTYGFLEGDAEVLASLRKILPPKCKIYPYVKRKPNVLPTQPPRAREAKKRTKAEKKALAKAAKIARKTKTVEDDSRRGLMCFRKRVNEMRKSKIQRKQEKEARKRDEKLKGITRANKKAYTGPFTGKTSEEKKAISASMKAHRANIKKVEKARMKNFTKTHVTKNRRIIMPKATNNASKSVEMASTSVKQAA